MAAVTAAGGTTETDLKTFRDFLMQYNSATFKLAVPVGRGDYAVNGKMSHLNWKVSLSKQKCVTELCFKACVRDFTSRTIEDKEEKCNNNCLDKFLKMSQRMGLRFQEYQLLQAESSGATLRQ